jgi:predicted nuclease with RNAse H fold
MGIYVGFDPGGSGAFGWSVLSGEALPLRLVGHGIADHAQGVFEAAMSCAGPKINAVGIDAPLFWNPAGDREADRVVRRAIRERGCSSASGTVNAVNALRGACVIQGVLIAMLCQRRYGTEMRITEAHPKALLWLTGKASSECRTLDISLSDLSEYILGSRVEGANDHQRDAALGAVAAYYMLSRPMGWRDLYPLERNPITPLNPPPGYWMPLPPKSV